MTALDSMLNFLAKKPMVLDTGTSGYWTYRKWSDGTYEAWTNTYFSATVNTPMRGGFYYSEIPYTTLPFPVEFEETPVVTWSTTNGFAAFYTLNWTKSGFQDGCYVFAPGELGYQKFYLSIYIKGKVKIVGGYKKMPFFHLLKKVGEKIK